ncbi:MULTISPECIES: IPT/TIG domain-containing protein [Bacteroides]|uniref:IPT/TIG domain-containing protein n=2 Tax=Bacteroides TaxID=816 RepID=UPI001C9C7804|nr:MULTISPECIES: IPT/TIG domain-containing protein [Bacteroides]
MTMNLKYRFSTILMSSLLLASGLFVAACGDDDLDNMQTSVNGVTLKSFGPCPLTRGESMEVIGVNLGKVSKVLFPKGNQRLYDTKTYEEAQFSLNTDGKLSVTVPDEVVPGKLRLVVGSDTIVSNSFVSFKEEGVIKNVELSSTDVRAGDIITVKGEYVWNMIYATFADNVVVYAEDFLKNTRNEIQIAVPAAAVSGEVTYYDGNANEIQQPLIEDLQIRQATVERLSNESPELGEEITIFGKDLDLVGCANFPFVDSVKVVVNEAGTELKCIVPSKTTPGDINLAQYSGKKISVPYTPLMIEVSGVTPKEDLKAGDRVTITGTRLDKVQYILLPGDLALASDEFSGSATQITFTVPEGMADGEVKVVQHENYSLVTEKIAMHHEGAELTIWSGKKVIGNWDVTMDALSWSGGAELWPTVQPGQVMSIYVTVNEGVNDAKIRVGNGSWVALPGTSDLNDLVPGDNVIRITLTEAMINELVNNGGLVLCGAYFTVTSVTLSLLETVIWRGSWNCSGGTWAGNQDLAYGAYDWSTFQEGQKIVFTFDSADPTTGWGCISPRMGGNSWANLSVSQINFTPSAEEQSIEFIPTADDIAHLQNDDGLVITGDGFILKKVSIK